MKFVIMEAWHFNNCMPMKIHLITGFRQEVTLKIIPKIVRCLFYLSGWFSFNLVHTDWQFQSSVADLQCKKKEKKKNFFQLNISSFFYYFISFQCGSVWIYYMTNVFLESLVITYEILSWVQNRKCVYSEFTFDGSLVEVLGQLFSHYTVINLVCGNCIYTTELVTRE